MAPQMESESLYALLFQPHLRRPASTGIYQASGHRLCGNLYGNDFDNHPLLSSLPRQLESQATPPGAVSRP